MNLNNVKITWLGHGTFLLQTPEKKKILVDPWLAGNPSCPSQFHNMSFDAVLMTHGHFDHIGDIQTIHKRCNGPIVGIFELTSWLGKKGIEGSKLTGMNKGGTIELAGLNVKVTMTDAKHSSSWTEKDGTIVYLGEPAGYVVKFSNNISLYFAGDTALFGDMSLIGELYKPDLAALPIGDHFTMDPKAAAYACRLLGVKVVIPCHHSTFPLLTGTVDNLKKEISKLGLNVEVIAIKPGESI